MVSQLEPSRSLSVRGPSSVVSRSSNTRHRRQNRSHAGGSSYAPQNEFPIFTNTGDVDILINAGGKENRYLLHRLILTQCSGFFEASTSQEWSRADSEASKELTRIGEDVDTGEVAGRPSSSVQKQRWRYELDKGADNNDIPMLVQSTAPPTSLFNSLSPPPVRNKPPGASTSFFRSVANLSISASTPITQEGSDLLRDYDNLFRIFYNYPPSLDPINIADAYIQCKSLLALADMYDALVVVGPRIDHHLLQFQSRLFKQIAKYPPSYLRLGYMARSKVIFAEALIHVVGQWPAGERHLRQALPQQVVELIEDKVDELADIVAGVEGRLFRLSLMTSRGERVNPQSNYLEWLAVSLFRQWFADNTSPAPSPPPKPPSRTNQSEHDTTPESSHRMDVPPPYTDPPVPYLGRVYRLLGSGSGNAYLGHEECKRFLKLSPELYSRESLRRFERKIDEMKILARETVAPLMRCTLQGGAEGVSYLTCTRIGNNDWVWENE